MPRRITKAGELSNPVIRSFIASFDVALKEAVLQCCVKR